MQALRMMLLLGLVACSTPGVEYKVGAATAPAASTPFAGSWEACEGTSSHGECSRYVLMQRGERICGIWFYVASGKSYEGRVIARATSATTARRTHVCGRPGSETGMECEDGWESIDRPLQLCDGKLDDLGGGDGTCLAGYHPAPASRGDHASLSAHSWVQDCLSTDP